VSSSSSTPNPANLGGNVQNANQTAATATSNAQQTMNTAQALNTQSQNNLTGVLGTTNAAAGALTNQANSNMQQYGSTFQPLQQTEANAAQQYGSAANIQRLQGQAIAGTNAANQASLNNSRAALAAEGVDPASIGGAAQAAQAGVAGAANTAAAGTQAGIQAQQTAFGMENQANQLGVQVGNMGNQGQVAGAQVAQGGQQVGNQTEGANINALGAANQYLNTDVNANAGAVNAANTGFNEQMQQYNAQQAQGAGIGQLAGTALGAASMFMEEGGPIPTGAGIPTESAPADVSPQVPMFRPGKRTIATGKHRQPAGITTSDFSRGGMVGRSGAYARSPIPNSTDTKPAMLTPGEFVMPKDVVDFKGQDFFHRQIDSIRAAANERRAIPVNHFPHVSNHAP